MILIIIMVTNNNNSIYDNNDNLNNDINDDNNKHINPFLTRNAIGLPFGEIYVSRLPGVRFSQFKACRS